MKLSTRTTNISLPGFTLTATGMVSKGKPTFKKWEEVGRFFERAEGAVQWWIGDWLNYGEGRPQ